VIGRRNIWYNWGMKDRSDYPVRKTRLDEQELDDDYKGYTMAELMGMVWPLTVSAWAMKGEDISDRRLQRHVVRVRRRGR
jgi:hypothetical protein